MEERKVKFEAWVLAQFGDNTKHLLRKKDFEYVDELISTLWIAFNAGVESTKW